MHDLLFQKNAVITQPENSTFKFEPFILHVLCQSLEDAQRVVRGICSTYCERYSWGCIYTPTHPAHTVHDKALLFYQHVIALEAGFKNSGITVSKKGNVMLVSNLMLVEMCNT